MGAVPNAFDFRFRIRIHIPIALAISIIKISIYVDIRRRWIGALESTRLQIRTPDKLVFLAHIVFET